MTTVTCQPNLARYIAKYPARTLPGNQRREEKCTPEKAAVVDAARPPTIRRVLTKWMSRQTTSELGLDSLYEEERRAARRVEGIRRQTEPKKRSYRRATSSQDEKRTCDLSGKFGTEP